MNGRIRYWQTYQPSPITGYSAAVLLAVAAQLARLPLHPPTVLPYVTYVPFIVLSAVSAGLGPGMLTTGICIVESLYFARPLAGFAAGRPRQWVGLTAMVFSGLITGWVFDSLKRAWRSYAAVTEANIRMTQEIEMRKRMLESVIEYSPVAIALLEGPDFKYSLVNPAYQALLPSEAPGGRTFAAVWPAMAPQAIPLLNIVREAQTVYHVNGSAVPVSRGGSTLLEMRYLDFSYVPVPVPGEEDATQVLVCALDVTERRSHEMALRGAYSQLAAIYANVPAVLLVIDEDLRVQEANAMAARLAERDIAATLGLAPGAALGCANAALRGCGQGPTCGQCIVRSAILDTLRDGARHECVEAWLSLHVEGQWQERCLVVSTTAIDGDGGRKVLVCAQDITERKQSERKLDLQHKELQRQAELINLSHDAIITADADRVIRSWNRGAEEIYGWTEAEAVGHKLNELLQTRDLTFLAEVDEVLSRENQWSGEIEHSRRDGARILVDSRQVLLRDAADTGIRILEINRDVTERRRAVRQLESAVAEKTVLLQEVHHRVKNNLAVTASLLSMKADSSGPEARLALEESQRRVHSIALVHEHLYDCDRLDRINFGEYARELAEGVRSTFAGEQRRIGLDFDLDPIEVGIERAVPCALILNELLSNAFKYAFTGGRIGRIRISLRQLEPGWCELAVEDDGVGLPAGALEGTNQSLGLRIVGILANQLDGSIGRGDGAGTRIVLRFPAAA